MVRVDKRKERRRVQRQRGKEADTLPVFTAGPSPSDENIGVVKVEPIEDLSAEMQRAGYGEIYRKMMNILPSDNEDEHGVPTEPVGTTVAENDNNKKRVRLSLAATAATAATADDDDDDDDDDDEEDLDALLGADNGITATVQRPIGPPPQRWSPWINPSTSALPSAVLRRLRPPLVTLRRVARRPELVTLSDPASPDPLTTIHLAGLPHVAAVVRHWASKRPYLSYRRGLPPAVYALPSEIVDCGVMELRDEQRAGSATTDLKNLAKQRMHVKVSPPANYEALLSAFTVHQTVPELTPLHALWFEGREFFNLPPNVVDTDGTATALGPLGAVVGESARASILHGARASVLPRPMSAALCAALGLPEDDPTVPVPWLQAMQRWGPPPGFPPMQIPGLTSPLPPGASYGWGQGQWGGIPVNDKGAPYYGGDPFGAPVPPSLSQAMKCMAAGELPPCPPLYRWGAVRIHEREVTEVEDNAIETIETDTAMLPVGADQPTVSVAAAPHAPVSAIHITVPALEEHHPAPLPLYKTASAVGTTTNAGVLPAAAPVAAPSVAPRQLYTELTVEAPLMDENSRLAAKEVHAPLEDGSSNALNFIVQPFRAAKQ